MRLTAAVLMFVFVTSPALAGPLAPEDPPAPTHKTLTEVEPRTPISTPDSFPIVIDQPGSYYFTENIKAAGGHGVVITASRVTLDLNGFTLYSTDEVGTNYGILLSKSKDASTAPPDNITLRNGLVRGFTSHGLYCAAHTPRGRGLRVQDMSFSHNAEYGVLCRHATGSWSQVHSHNNSGWGMAVAYSTVVNSTIMDNAQNGIGLLAALIKDSIVSGNGFGGNYWGVNCDLNKAGSAVFVNAHDNGDENTDNIVSFYCGTYQNLTTHSLDP